jgi:hypothetical protein
MRPFVVAIAASLGVSPACSREPVELPEPWRPPVVEVRCDNVVPPPPPTLIQSPVDLGECLPSSFEGDSLPITVSVDRDGRVGTELTFQSPCGWVPVPIPSGVEPCLRAKLKEYRWFVMETCPGEGALEPAYLSAVKPSPKVVRVARDMSLPRWTGSGCGG